MENKKVYQIKQQKNQGLLLNIILYKKTNEPLD